MPSWSPESDGKNRSFPFAFLPCHVREQRNYSSPPSHRVEGHSYPFSIGISFTSRSRSLFPRFASYPCDSAAFSLTRFFQKYRLKEV